MQVHYKIVDMNKKIGILKLRLCDNYGGILQNYALQSFLREIGKEPITFLIKNRFSWKSKLKSYLYRCFRRCFYKDIRPLRKWKKEYEDNVIYENINRFISQNITMTEQPICFGKCLFYEKELDAIIVGSDQVWRYKYVPNIEEYFLKSFTSAHNIKRIAYAASFGVDQWELPSAKTLKCAKLAQQFDAISVREDNGITLCKKHLNCNAVHVLDPTMLLTKDSYVSLVEKDKIPISKGNLLIYILDLSDDKKDIIALIKNRFNLKEFTVMPAAKFEDVGPKQLNDCIFPPVTAWIRGFMDAEYVITDSFHGTVFSIIFNKPFITIANKQRGIARFQSLLKMFGLENRLVNSSDQITEELLQSSIDFKKVNRIHGFERVKSSHFLHSTLNECLLC